MGSVLKAPAAMFGIGQKDDPTYNPQTNQSGAYNNFANNEANEFSAANNSAQDEITNGSLTSGLFGQGGVQSQLQNEGNELASKGYQLNDQDREAYGQASGDISRQFGQQEQDASKMLARRGLGGGASGAAGATFSGLAGSKNEMLAKAQTDIAQKRMQDTTQRLQANRSMQQSLGMEGQGLKNNMAQQRFDNKGNALKNAAGIESGVNEQGRQANEDAIGHKSKNIGDAWAEGKYSGTKSGEADATSSWMKMGGSSSMGMSDENNKQNVTDGAPKVRSFLQGIANSHDYSVIPQGKTQGNDPQSQKQQSGGGSKPPWAAGLQQPNKDGTYTPSAGESARMEQGTSGLGAPMQDGSGGMTSGGATPDSGLTSMFGGGAGAGAGEAGSGGGAELMSMFSDENMKEGVSDGSDQIRGFLDSVSPHSYEYKDEYQDNPMAGDGSYVSPMAQELEQTELGSDMVQDTPDGKVVDYGKGFGTLLAGVADINKRLSKMEGRKV